MKQQNQKRPASKGSQTQAFQRSPSQIAYSEKCKAAIARSSPKSFEEVIANVKLVMSKREKREPRDSEKKV